MAKKLSFICFIILLFSLYSSFIPKVENAAGDHLKPLAIQHAHSETDVPASDPFDARGTIPEPYETTAPHKNGKNINVGEHFIYKLKWNGIPVGASELKVLGTTEIMNKKVYHVVNRVWTEGFVALFFKVENSVESFIDPVESLPLRYTKNIKESRYQTFLSVDFDQVNHKAIRKDTTFTIPEKVQDPLSILWYFRQKNIKEGEIVKLNYCDGKKNQKLEVRILKKDHITTPLGRFATDVITFSVGKKDRDYLKKEIRLTVWFSDDEMRMPVLIKAKANVGSITGTLTQIKKISSN